MCVCVCENMWRVPTEWLYYTVVGTLVFMEGGPVLQCLLAVHIWAQIHVCLSIQRNNNVIKYKKYIG